MVVINVSFHFITTSCRCDCFVGQMELILKFYTTLKLSDSTCTVEYPEATKSPLMLSNSSFHTQLLLSVQPCSVNRETNCSSPAGREKGNQIKQESKTSSGCYCFMSLFLQTPLNISTPCSCTETDPQ